MSKEKRYISIIGQDEKNEKIVLIQHEDLDEKYNLVVDYLDYDKEICNGMRIEILVVGKFHTLTITEKNNNSHNVFLNLQDSYSEPAKIENLIFNNVDNVKVLGGIAKVMFLGNENTINSMDITMSRIDTLLTNKIDNLNLNSCFVNELILNVNGSSQNSNNLYTKSIISVGSEIKKIMVINTIKSIEILKSKIDELIILKAKIDSYQNKETKIKHIRGICIDTFETHSEDSCNLGIMYSKENDDYELYEFYNVQKMELALKRSSMKNKIPLWFLKYSIGYGFKPLKAFSFSLISIIFFASIYLISDLFRGKIVVYYPEGINDIFNSIELILIYIYQSGITYTTIGFEDMILVNPLVGLIYVLEAMLGVSVLSLMVVSLTRKYFFGKY